VEARQAAHWVEIEIGETVWRDSRAVRRERDWVGVRRGGWSGKRC